MTGALVRFRLFSLWELSFAKKRDLLDGLARL